MMLIITGVGFLIHLYSIGYMHEDEGYGKFFSYMNLFIFFMLLLVMGANYVIMFIGWEGVGLCSYLLIGFWWKDKNFSAAANKAFIMNRIGDLGFILGIFLMFKTFGSSDFDIIFSSVAPFSLNDPVIVSITLLLFVGAIGKSAQIPLFTWLPDAMAGPTPVSALIHAATMVTAGVYMVVRSNILYSLAPFTLEIVSITGLLTAILGALIALTQNDIKKVLAYSTVSQLGYMFVALGSSAYSSGIFHVMTHAFFKALLFLGAGSVIHALGGEQNIRNMGGLKKYLPVTSVTFFIATLAISGFPPFSGFFSKDEIILMSYANNPVFFYLLVLTSILTGIYMFRLYFLVFWGTFRGTPHQHDHLHESPLSIIVPLMILSFFSVFAGLLGLPEFITDHHWLNTYLTPVFSNNTYLIKEVPTSTLEFLTIIFLVLALLLTIAATYNLYVKKRVESLNESHSFFYKLSYNKFYVDELYHVLFVHPLLSFSKFFRNYIENNIIDGSVNGAGNLTVYLSTWMRKIQTGNIGLYVIMMVAGIVAILVFGLSKLFAF